MRHVIIPELAIAAEIDGKVAGAAFGLLDYNPRIKEIDGRLFPFGFIHLLRNRRAIKAIRVISTNVLPEYQRLGVGLVLMAGLVPKVLEWGVQEAEFSWVLESNSLSYGSLKKGGAKITKTYRLYDWEEAEAGSPAAEIRGHERAAKKGDEAVRRPVAVSALPAILAAPLEIRPVLGRGDLHRFLKVPWRVYAQDPQWVPPLLLDVKEFLNRRKHPFYQHGDATQFVAVRGGETVGRVLVSDDPLCNQQRGENVGCFGMFECLDDPPAAQALLDAAADWLRARGRTAIRGPIDYSLNYPCGLLVDGFDTPPRIMMNHNRPYFAGLLESWGLRKVKDLYAWWFVDPLDLVAKWRVRAGRLARRARDYHSPFPHRRLCGRGRPLPGRLQRRHERVMGLRQAHAGRVSVYGQTA